MLRKTALTGLCLALSVHAAFAACAGPRDVAALKIASLQQRLMVAGLACHDSEAYNRFVLAHRAELQRSDDDLKAWFIANGGEAGYDSYKTKLANLAAHGPATDQGAFCATAARDFRNLAGSGDLQMMAGYEALLTGKACETPVVAEAEVKAPMRVARAEIKGGEDVVAAPRQLPAMPYDEAPPPRPQAAIAMRDEEDAAPIAVAASREDIMPSRARGYADADLPRPSYASLPARRDNARYWYYRRLYARGYRGED